MTYSNYIRTIFFLSLLECQLLAFPKANFPYIIWAPLHTYPDNKSKVGKRTLW